MKIVQLDREKYDYYELFYRYETSEHYVVTAETSRESMGIKYVREKLKEPKVMENTDTLFQEYWSTPEAYGVQDDDGKLVAFLETDREEWNSRLRVTQLLVLEPYRRRGIGKMLLDFVKDMAKEQDYRVVILETQSINVPAIDFYYSQGFRFCGGNIYFYSDIDIDEDEVMLEMAYLTE